MARCQEDNGRTLARTKDNRGAEILRLFETYQSTAKTITANLRDMTLSADEVVVVNCRVKPCLFTKSGLERYSDQERRQVADIMVD